MGSDLPLSDSSQVMRLKLQHKSAELQVCKSVFFPLHGFKVNRVFLRKRYTFKNFSYSKNYKTVNA